MAIEKLSDNVGKKIVEALKMQNEKAQTPQDNSFMIKNFEQDENTDSTLEQDSVEDIITPDTQKTLNQFDIDHQETINNAFAQSIAHNLGTSFQSMPAFDVELPSNVVILNNLISKLPVGVSKQTGALIIKQTIEALGIPMSSVLQEAKQVQENLISNARECQKNVIEYKKQITLLENKSQMYQRQSIALDEMINLFVKSSI